MDGLILSAGCTGEGRRLIEGSLDMRVGSRGGFLDEVYFFFY